MQKDNTSGIEQGCIGLARYVDVFVQNLRRNKMNDKITTFDFTQIKDEKMKAFAIQQAMSFPKNNIIIPADALFKLHKEIRELRKLMQQNPDRYENQIKKLQIQERTIDKILVHNGINKLIDKIEKTKQKVLKYG